MVWIHGGGFIIGSGSLPLYDASALVRRNVIVVSINYRLGRLGFLVHPALSAEQGGASGNYGLMDQVAALHWVERNIAAFGGDPDNVTLFGESAGGLSILALMTSPMAADLFDKAIVQSGLGLAALSQLRDGPFAAEAMGAAWTAGRGMSSVTPQELRGMSAEQVLEGQTFAGPVLDGVVLSRSPGDAFRRGEQARIPLIIGANSFEASLTEFLSEGLARATLGNETYDTLLARYAEREPIASARDTLIGEVFGMQPARFIAREHSGAGSSAFLYYFDQVRASQRRHMHGAPHAGELPYLFGTPQHFFTEWPMSASPEWDGADQRVSDAVIGYWTAFARSGDPNLGGAPRWEPVRASDAQALYIDETIEMRGFDTLADETESAAVAASIRQWR
jgi:para-nitrobenzyl esterase